MAGAKQLMGVALAACLASVVFQVSSAASSHIVGDSSGWIIPSSSSFYTSWAAKETFNVGDFLVFNFMSGAHTVAEVKKSDYDSCTTTSPLSQLNNGPANISISSAGAHYYICTVPGHCLAGQKLSITASAATSTPSSPTAAPTPTKSTPTPSASPTPKSSPAVPTPSAGAPTPSAKAPTPVAASPTPSHSSSISMPPTSYATPPAAAPMSSMGSPAPSPETAPTPSSGASPSASPSAVAGGPPAPSSPSEAPSSPPKSDSTVAGAGLVLPLLVIIGASLLY